MNKYVKMFMDDNNLKVGEKFGLYNGSYHYYFSNDGDLKYVLSTGENRTSLKLANVLNNEYRIKKLSPMPSEKFVPKEGERYYFFNTVGKISYFAYSKDDFDAYVVSHNLVFKTREQVEDYKWFLDKVDEYKKPFVIEKPNYYLYFNLCNKTVYYSHHDSYKDQGTIYFGDEKNISEFIEEVGEERIKKYMFDIWEE